MSRGRRPFLTKLTGLVVALAFAAGCTTTNPATGQQDFTLFMPEGEEARIGADEHPKILARFGGAYDDPEIGAYVAGIGGRLVHNTERPDIPFRFTVLNTPGVNAFAVPGGYVYVTRGLVALANSEAELAGVLAHEIGHVVARHTAQRYSRAAAAQLGTALLGAVTGSRQIGQLAQIGSELYLSSFSRDQEFEADLLGVRYLVNTGYEPAAQAHFLESLILHKDLEAKLAGEEGREPEASFFSTHPRTPERVQRAIAAAGGGDGGRPALREEYLARIDAMLYGDDAEQGFVRGRQFLHPVMRFALEVPPGYRLFNTTRQLIAKGPQKALIVLDDAGKKAHPDPFVYLTSIWAARLSLQEAERIDINGFEAATGRSSINTKHGPMNLRLIAIRFRPKTILRMSFITPPQLVTALSEAHRRATYSFRALSEAEAARLRPYRMRIITVGVGDTVESLAARMPYEDFRIERFRALNGLKAYQRLTPGQRAKIVVED